MKRVLGILLAAIVALTALGVVIVWLRQSMALKRMEAERDAPLAPLPALGSTSRLEIIPLAEADASRPELQSEHGLSYLIRTDAATLLMDFGLNAQQAQASPLESNMAALGVGWQEIDALVISHNHPDHIGGVSWWIKGSFGPGRTQPDLAGKPAYVPVRKSYPGLESMAVRAPQAIAAGVASMGVLPFPELTPFSIVNPRGEEQTLAVNVAGQGIVLISGCGHPGVPAMVARAEALFDEPVVGIIGGLHYPIATQEDVQPQIAFLQKRNIQWIGLSPHDSSVAALQAFHDAFPTAYRDVRVGEAIVIGE